MYKEILNGGKSVYFLMLVVNEVYYDCPFMTYSVISYVLPDTMVILIHEMNHHSSNRILQKVNPTVGSIT